MSHMACLMAAPNLRESVLGQERLLWMLKFTAGVGENKMVCIVVLSELIQSCNSSLYSRCYEAEICTILLLLR